MCSEGDMNTAKYEFIFVFALLMVFVVPIGIPAVLFALMWSKREAIEERATRRGGDELKYLSFLFRLVSYGSQGVTPTPHITTNTQPKRRPDPGF